MLIRSFLNGCRNYRNQTLNPYLDDELAYCYDRGQAFARRVLRWTPEVVAPLAAPPRQVADRPQRAD
jgi:hypothetical protein